MDKKGQMFALDLVISTVLVIAAISIAMQFLETKQLEAKEAILQKELEQFGNTAAELLSSNPAIVCELKSVGNATLYFLPNCLSKTKTITKTELGIPASYNCLIEGTSVPTECSASPTNAENVFSAARKILTTNNASLAKAGLYACMDNDNATACVLAEENITIKVWKA